MVVGETSPKGSALVDITDVATYVAAFCRFCFCRAIYRSLRHFQTVVDPESSRAVVQTGRGHN